MKELNCFLPEMRRLKANAFEPRKETPYPVQVSVTCFPEAARVVVPNVVKIFMGSVDEGNRKAFLNNLRLE